MSQTPYCPNELSPWPKIQYIDRDHGADTSEVANEMIDGSEPIDSKPRLKGSWKQRLTTAGSKALWHGRRTSFASSQQYKDDKEAIHGDSLDHEASAGEIRRLLRLRKRRMKEARQNGDESEVHRLKNLGLFDNIDGSNCDEPTPSAMKGLAGPPSSIPQGHTAELCQYMKTQESHGVTIPSDFSTCTIHTHSIEPSTQSIQLRSNLDTASLSTPSPSNTRASTSSKSSTIATSIWLDSDNESLISKDSNEHPKQSSATLGLEEEEDPFLYIAKCLRCRPHTTHRFARRSASRSTHRNQPSPCICVCHNHTCHTYLSSTPSQHCPTCILPAPQPEIRAAISRIAAYRSSVDSDNRLSKAIQTTERLQEDLVLVETYNAEMEERCRDGVWWEGWLVVRELKGRGIVGSLGEG